jgi:hypothetical protein
MYYSRDTMPDPQGTATVPPPPSGDPSTDIQGAGNGGGMDKFRSIISRLSGGGTPAIDKALAAHHDQVVADAKRHAEAAKRYYGMVARAKATGKNPVTGQPVTPEEIAQWQQQGDGAWADYTKIAGKAKAAKPIIAQMGGLLKHITGSGQGPQGGGQPQGGTPAAPGSPAGGPSAPQQQGSQTVPPPPAADASSAPKATVPPPPTGDNMAIKPAPTGDRMNLQRPSNPLQEQAQGEFETGAIKDQSARLLKDEEYRDKLTAEADPRYHVNEIKRFRDDLKDAFPNMAPEDVEKAVLTKAGVTPKGTGKEMQPDFKDGMLVGVKDPATNQYYTDPAKMPPEAKAIYDSAKKVEKAHEDQQEAKENRQLTRQIEVQTRAFQNALERSDYVAAKKEVTKAKSDYDAAIDRQTTMHKNLEAAKKGDQQAMLSLVANHIGMTLGAQKGARITRAVWDEATSSAPWMAKLEAKFDNRGYLSGVTLTPDQMRQMVDLADEKTGILKEHVDRVQDEYSSELGAKSRGRTVSAPPNGKGPKAGDIEDGYKFKGGDPADKANWVKQ